MPQLSDLFTRRQIAWIWLISNIGMAAGGTVIASPILSGASMSTGAWILLAVGASVSVFGVLFAAAKEDPRQMAPISVDGFPALDADKIDKA